MNVKFFKSPYDFVSKNPYQEKMIVVKENHMDRKKVHGEMFNMIEEVLKERKEGEKDGKKLSNWSKKII